MNTVIPKTAQRSAVEAYCAAIGSDPLLVQGAGGNVSWKDGDRLWVKSSGTWLADAAEKDIFVPVDLPPLREAIAGGNFEVKPRVCGDSPLRPSIETLLHALMPHPVVVHIHAVEVLAHLVRRGFQDSLGEPPNDTLRWVSVGYHKPGAALAMGVAHALASAPGANVIFLENHGVVVGGDSVTEVDATLRLLIAAFQVEPRSPNGVPAPVVPFETGPDQTWLPVEDPMVHQLATDPALFDYVQSAWALYPDHVVFLGPRPCTADDVTQLAANLPAAGPLPDAVFIRDKGVFAGPDFNSGKLAQLRCYYEVLARQAAESPLAALSDEDIGELLNWDAERYRIQMAK